MLGKILSLNGEILIGDEALRQYIKDGGDKFYDMSEIWYQKTGLPFVFGLFCCNKNQNLYKKIINQFLKQKIKIPKYILNEYSKSRNIHPNMILWYLEHISYDIKNREKLALKKFISLAKKHNFHP